MSRDTSRYLWLSIGQTGTGKTYVIEKMIAAMYRPVIVVDSTAEWGSYGTQYDSPAALLDSVAEVLTGEVKEELFVLKCDRIEKAESLLWHANKWKVPGTYVLDEIHQWAGTKATYDPLMNMIRMGRHARQSIVGASQRAQAVNKHLLEESALCVFRQQGLGAERVEAQLPGAVGKEQISQLGKQEYYVGGYAEDLPIPIGERDGEKWTWNEKEGRCTHAGNGTSGG